MAGYKNFTKSDMLNVPRNLKTRSYAPETKLAYITPEEEGILQALKPGTPHKGPEGIPNYDSFGTEGETGQSGGDVDQQRGGRRSPRESQQASVAAANAAANYVADLMAQHEAKPSAADEQKKRELAALNKRHREEARKERAGAALPTIAEEREGQVDKIKKSVREAQLKRSEAARFYPEFAKDYERSPGDSLKLLDKLQNLSGRISDYKINFPSILGMGAEMLKSFGLDKKEIIKKMMRGKPLSQREEQAIAGLLAAQKRNVDVLPRNMIYAKEGDHSFAVTDPEKYLRTGYRDWEGFETDEEYERMIRDYETGKPGGLGDLFGLLEGRTEGTTLEDLREGLTSGEEHYLKMNRPDLYYKFNDPQTSGGIADLAGMDAQKYTSGPDYNKELAQKIFDAREQEGRTRSERREMGILGYDPVPGGGGGGEDYGLPGTTPPGTMPPGTTPGAENQWMTASPGQIGYYNPNVNPATGMPWGYQWGTTSDYNPYAEVNLAKGGIIGMDRGGYLDDYQAADSLMFKDPQEDEEWEYNV